MNVRNTVFKMRSQYQLPLTTSDVALAQSVIRKMKEKYGAELELDDEYESWIVQAGLLHRYLGKTMEDLEWVNEWFPQVPLSGWVKLFVNFIWRRDSHNVDLVPRVVKKITKAMEKNHLPRQSKYVATMVEILLGHVTTGPRYGLKPLQTKYVLSVQSEHKDLLPQRKLNVSRLRLSMVQRLHRGLKRTHLTGYNLDKHLIILGPIGSESVYGEAYAVCIRDKNNDCKGYWTRNPFHLALKLQTVKSRAGAQKLWNELHFLRWGQKMVERGICINFPLVYKLVVMPNVVTAKHDIVTRKGSLTIGIMNELANGDFGHWLKHATFGYNTLSKFLLQGFMALYVVQHLWKSYHNDLHVGNFLYNDLDKPKRFVYDVVGKGRFIVKNCNFLVKLWDFGEMDNKRPKEALDDVEKIFTSVNEVLLKKGSRMYTRRMRNWVRKMATVSNVWDALIELSKQSRDIHYIPWNKVNHKVKPKTLYYSKIEKFPGQKQVRDIRPILTQNSVVWAQDFRRLK